MCVSGLPAPWAKVVKMRMGQGSAYATGQARGLQCALGLPNSNQPKTPSTESVLVAMDDMISLPLACTSDLQPATTSLKP
jgi:hypothetical protein